MDGQLPPQSEPGSHDGLREPAERPEAIAALIRTIERRHGYLPASYLPAVVAHDVLADLWHHTRRAHLDNPLPSAFKERLLTYLARHCAAPYCLLVHGSALIGRGADPETIRPLLDAPARPSVVQLEQDLELIASAPAAEPGWPAPGSPLEQAVLRCAEALFLRHACAARCRDTLKVWLGPRLAPRLFALLGYAETLHLWTEVHPEICFVPDLHAVTYLDDLLEAVPELPELVAALPVGSAPAPAARQIDGERMLARVSEQTSDFVYRITLRPRPRFEYASASVERITGHPPEAYYQDPELLFRSAPEDDRRALRELLTRRPHLVTPRVLRFRRRTGEEQWLEHRVATELDDSGEVVAVEGIARDVTDRVRAEQLVRDSERLLRAVFDSLEDAVLVSTPEHRVATYNRAAERMFGYTSEELARDGMTLLHVDPPTYDQFLRRVHQALDTSTVVRINETMRRRSGELFPTEHTITQLRGAGGEATGFVSVIRDATERQRAEAAVRTSEARWRSLAESAPQHVITVSPDLVITFANRDFDPEHTLPVGAPLLDRVAEAAREPLREALSRAAATLEPVKTDCCSFERDGQPTFYETTVVPLVRERRLTELLVSATEVTEQKRTEAALRESEQRWRLLVENSPQHIVTVEPDLRISFISRALSGRDPEKLLNTHALERVAPGSIGLARSTLERVLRTGEPETYELETLTESGASAWFEVSAARIVRGDGSHALLLNSRNVTDRVEAERRLRDSEQRWREILQNAPNTILCLDLEGRITFVNHALPALIGGSVVGRSFYDLVPPERREALRELLQHVVESGQRESYEMTGLGPAGLTACFQNTIGPLTSRGRVEALIVVSTDISDRKLAETALQESEERFRAVFEHGPIGMAMVAPDLTLVRANQTLCEMLGYGEEECRGMPVARTYPPTGGERFAEIARRLFAGELEKLDFERPLRARDGRLIWGHVTASVVRAPDGTPLYGLWMVEDVDERRRAEEALRRSAAQLAEAQRLANVGSWSWSFVDDSFEYSDELLRIYALAREDVGADYRKLIARVHPEDREAVKRVTGATLRERQPYDFEHRIVRPDGEVRILRSRGFVEHDPAGKPQRIYGTVEDVTEERRAYEERTLLYREAQAAVRARDEFLSIASHDLKSPLNALRLQVQMLVRAVRRGDRELLRPETLLPKLETAERQIEKLVRLLAVLLDVSRLTAGRMEFDYEQLELGAIACELVSRAGEAPETRGAPIRLHVPEPVVGRWDRLRLEQILTNLLSNAVKYGEGKPVDLEVVRNGRFARISVRDYGQGIAPEDQQRIFERFERAEGRRAGSFGLGLWIVRRIVEAMHGEVGVDSRKGAGATFTVVLPLEPS